MSAITASRRSSTIALVGVLVVATALRLYRLDAESLWLDETFSLTLARGSWSFLFAEAVDDFHPPLYFVLLKAWCAVAGDSAWSARLLSVVISVAGVASGYVAGTRLLSRRAGLAAATVLALSTFQVEFAQEARMYGLVGLLATWSTLALYRLMAAPTGFAARDGRNGPSGPNATPPPAPPTSAWWIYVITSTCLVYTHAVSFFVLFAHAVVVLGTRLQDPASARAFERWIWAVLAVGVAFLPWISTFALQFTTVQRGFWIGDPTATDLPRTIQVFAGSARLALVVFGLALAGVLTLHRSRPGPGTGVPSQLVLGAWLVVPVLAPFLASLVGAPIFLPKYTIAAAVPLALLASAGLVALPRIVATAALAVIVILSLQSLTAFHAVPRKDDWRGAIRDVEATAAARATVLLYPYFVDYPWRVYASRTDLVVHGFPRHAAETTTPTLLRMFDDLARATPETWLVVIGYDERRDTLVAHLREQYESVERRARGHVEVYRASRPRGPTALGPSPVVTDPRHAASP